MVKPPKIRHSKTRKDPVTIELEPGAVSRVEENPESGGTEPATEEIPEIKPASTAEAERTESPELPGDKVTAADTAGPREEDWVAFDQPAADDRPEVTTASAARSDEDTAEFGGADQREKMDTVSSAPPTVPPIEPRKQSRSGFSALAAGLIGGIVALAGAGGLQFVGLLPSSGAGGNDSAAVSALQGEVAGLKEQMTGLESGGGDVEAIQQALGESTSRVDGLSTALDQVKSDVASLKSAVEAGGAGENAGLQALQDKIAGLEKSVATFGQAGTGAAPAETAAISEKLAAVESAANAAAAATSANDARIGTLEKGLTTLEQSVAALTGKVDAQASQPKVALAIAVSALKAAVDAGGSFASEVETFAAVAPDVPELAELRSLGQKGVSSRAEIAAEAPDAATAMIEAGRALDENAGYFERLLSSAESLVKVRPVGPVEGAGVPETVARLEAALGSGDYAKALAEYETLPEAPKAAGQALMEKVRARLAAEQLVEKATAGALKA
jgi:hypothetical protein